MEKETKEKKENKMMKLDDNWQVQLFCLVLLVGAILLSIHIALY